MGQTKLILEPELDKQVQEILAPLKNPEQWKAMDIPFAPSPSAVVLFIGSPGTGKTALANYMARQLRKPPLVISFQNVASPSLGDTEKKIKSLFDLAHETESPTVFLEECDSILWSRELIDAGNVHQLGFVNTLLTEIDRFIARPVPSLILLSTNYHKLLDAAMLSRITDTIELFLPVGSHAQRLWKSKLPKNLQPSKEQLEWLSLQPMSPRDMETMIRKFCRKVLLENRIPSFTEFQSQFNSIDK